MLSRASSRRSSKSPSFNSTTSPSLSIVIRNAYRPFIIKCSLLHSSKSFPTTGSDISTCDTNEDVLHPGFSRRAAFNLSHSSSRVTKQAIRLLRSPRFSFSARNVLHPSDTESPCTASHLKPLPGFLSMPRWFCVWCCGGNEDRNLTLNTRWFTKFADVVRSPN